MSGDGKEVDIIDAAMAGDNYDYEKNEVIDTSAQQQSVDGEQTGEAVGSLSPDIQPQPQSQQQKPEGTSLPGLKPDGQRVQQQPQQQVRADPNNPHGFKRVGPQFADGKGNIVDKDGKIIAAAGQAARHWQEASRATAQVSNLTNQLRVMQGERQRDQELLRSAQEIASLPQRLGVTKEEYNDGITLLSNWKKNPVEVAREVVARTIALGHNVTDILGKNAGDALEMRAVSRLVDQATAPIRQQQEAAARTRQQEEATTTAYSKFVASHDYAEVHGDAIARLMQKGLPPERAYYEVRSFAERNGLDFTQPLQPQVDELVRRTQNTNQQQQNNGQRRPLPNGGSGGASQQNGQHQPANRDFGADDSWDSILRDAMSQ